jgi:protein O-mannosyl-transferase
MASNTKTLQAQKEKTQEKAFPPGAATLSIIIVILASVTVAAYWPVLRNGYINYDDPDYVTDNPHVQSGLTVAGIKWAFGTDDASNWHPLTWLSHMLDVSLFGHGPGGPHVVNLLLHTINTLLLFLLFWRMTGALKRSALVAGLFALHPQHVESVAWVAERKDVLSAFFWMLTLLAYASYVKQQKRKRYYGLAISAFVLGAMSKPMVVTIPFVMLLLDFWPLRRFEEMETKTRGNLFLQLALEKAPFFFISAVSCAVTCWAQKGALQTLEHLPLADRAANAVVTYLRYLGMTFWPENLALPYLHPGQWSGEQVMMAAITIAAISLGAVRFARKYPFAVTGWFWYLGTLVPVIGLVQVGIQAMADRYTYVPTIGIFIIIAWGTGEIAGRWPALGKSAATAVFLILAACGVLTHRQVKYWRDGETLFKHAAAVTEDNYIALFNVGGTYYEKKRLDEALDYYQQAIRINPNYAEGLNSIGAVLAAKGDENAGEWFRRALAEKPTMSEALFNLGNFLAKKGTAKATSGKAQEAVEYFQAALRAKPENFEARNNLANVLIELGKLEEAIAQYQLALQYQPGAAMIHKNLGEALAAKGKVEEAILHYRKAIALTNDAGAHYALGMALAVQGEWDEAIAQYNQTLRLWPTNAEVRYNLGYALRVQGRLEPARTNLIEALRLKPDLAIAHFNLGCVLAEQNRKDEAITHLQEALRLKPDYAEARDKLETLETPAPKP